MDIVTKHIFYKEAGMESTILNSGKARTLSEQNTKVLSLIELTQQLVPVEGLWHSGVINL